MKYIAQALEAKTNPVPARTEPAPVSQSAPFWIHENAALKTVQNETKSLVPTTSDHVASTTCKNRFRTAVPFFRSFRRCKWDLAA